MLPLHCPRREHRRITSGHTACRIRPRCPDCPAPGHARAGRAQTLSRTAPPTLKLRKSSDLPDQLITSFEAVTDVAVFYFVGHGQISSDNQLCLGLMRSRPDSNRRAATSLRFADVRQALQESSAAVKIVLLDCCFSGLAAEPTLTGPEGDVLDLISGTGAYTMAATSAYTTAWYENEAGLAEPQTYFTKYLADLVEEGIPGQPAQLRLDPLFKQLRNNLAVAGRPIPCSRAVNDAREFVFAYNAAPPTTHRDPEQELATLSLALAEKEREVDRLKEQMASTEPRDAEQVRELLDAIDNAARPLDDTRVAQDSRRASADNRAGPLTPREVQIVALLAGGASNAKMAETLFLSLNTVRTHLDRIRDKTGARSRVELTRYAMQAGIEPVIPSW
jgi:DNA-binding CsgD family transcriptional regulator